MWSFASLEVANEVAAVCACVYVCVFVAGSGKKKQRQAIFRDYPFNGYDTDRLSNAYLFIIMVAALLLSVLTESCDNFSLSPI